MERIAERIIPVAATHRERCGEKAGEREKEKMSNGAIPMEIECSFSSE